MSTEEYSPTFFQQQIEDQNEAGEETAAKEDIAEKDDNPDVCDIEPRQTDRTDDKVKSPTASGSTRHLEPEIAISGEVETKATPSPRVPDIRIQAPSAQSSVEESSSLGNVRQRRVSPVRDPPSRRESPSLQIPSPSSARSRRKSFASISTKESLSSVSTSRRTSLDSGQLHMVDVSEEVLAEMSEMYGPDGHNRHRKRRHSPLFLLREGGKHSPSSSSRQTERVSDGDGFPWVQQRPQTSGIEMDPTSVTMQSAEDLESRVSKNAKSRRRQCFPWWQRMVKTLEDNRAQTQEASQQLSLLDSMQESQFRLVRQILNLLFLVCGLVLLLAVIVLIIYTDQQFNESMKALTVFIAGRREGLW